MDNIEVEPIKPIIPNYLIKINTTAFNPKKCNLLQRTKEQYLPRYWQQCHMDQKRISCSSEDRLSELTTGQIDRIIDLQKIHTSLSNKKRKMKETFFNYRPKNMNSHPNTYKACFLAKINQIAIKRNIRHQSADLGIYVGEDANLGKNKVMSKPFKYKKQYEVDHLNKRKKKVHHAQDDDQKSISSIQDNLDLFEQKIEESKEQNNSLRITNVSHGSLRSRKKTSIPLSIKKKWFHGLSPIVTGEEKEEIKEIPKKQVLGRSITIDIQRSNSSDVSLFSNSSLKNQIQQKSLSTDIQIPSIAPNPLVQFKRLRVATEQ